MPWRDIEHDQPPDHQPPPQHDPGYARARTEQIRRLADLDQDHVWLLAENEWLRSQLP